MELLKNIFAVFVGCATILGVGYLGFEYAQYGLQDKLSEAQKVAYERGANEARRAFEDQKYRDETLAKLLSVVRSPTVRKVLSDNTNLSLESAESAIVRGDLKAASSILQSGVVAVAEQNCLPKDATAAVLEGTAISSCDMWQTRAIISNISTANNSVLVTVGGESQRIAPGGSFKPAKSSECIVLVERIEQASSSPPTARVSFDC